MKRSLLRRFTTISTTLLLSSVASIPAFGAQLYGHLDTVSASGITGWAWNAESPDETVSVELTVSSRAENGEANGTDTVAVIQAMLPREDLGLVLGSADHGFSYEVDWTKLTGDVFTVTASAVSGEEKTPLIGSFTLSREELATALIVSNIETPSPEAVQRALDASSTESTPGEFLGDFIASGYCNCQKCSGGHAKTYSGTVPQANHTLSADLNVFPLGTKLIIDGIIYTVEDRGSGVNNNRIDIYFASHEEALDFGLKTVQVYAPE